jgi:hypothetical protein
MKEAIFKVIIWIKRNCADSQAYSLKATCFYKLCNIFSSTLLCAVSILGMAKKGFDGLPYQMKRVKGKWQIYGENTTFWMN